MRDAPKGQRNDTLFQAGVRANEQGSYDRAEYAEAARAAGLGADETDATLNSAEDTARPIIGRTPEDLAKALAGLGYQWRFNSREQMPEINRGAGWQAVTERIEDCLICDVERAYVGYNSKPALFAKDTWRRCFNVLLEETQTDPFKAWLETLPEWDKKRRVEEWLAKCFSIGVDDIALMQWASRFLFLGAVWRTYQPATKLDEIVVLIGDQGIGKSTAIEYILPSEQRAQWFNDGLVLSDDDKTKIEALLGRVIVECAELAGLNGAQTETLKAFMTRTHDRKRLAYGRYVEEFPRRCIVVGTTNSKTPLPNDPTGNRRFVPVKLLRGDPREVRTYLDENRDQLWAEALHLYHAGLEAWLPYALKEIQADAADAARRKNEVLETEIANWLGVRNGDPFTMIDLARGIDYLKTTESAVDLDTRRQFHLGNILRQMGYDKRRPSVNGKRIYLWSK